MAEGGSPADTALRKIEALLLCTICKDNLKEPKILSCHHVFCAGCLHELTPQRHEGSFYLSCPTCREPCQLPNDGISSLPDAQYISDLNDVKNILQNQKENEDEQIDWTCDQGHQHICQQCIDARNKMIEVINNMTIANTREVEEMVSTAKALKPLFECPKHKKHLDHYCSKCEELICPHCIVGDHGDHIRCCEPISEAGVFDRHKEAIMDKHAIVQEQQVIIAQAIEAFNVKKKQIGENSDKVKKEIRAKGDQMIAAIEQEIKRLTQKVDRGRNQKLKFVSAQVEDAEKTRTRYEKCNESIAELLEGNKQQVLARKKEVLQMLTHLHPQVKKTTFSLTEEPSILFVPSKESAPLAHVGIVGFSTLSDVCGVTGEGLTKATHKEKASFELSHLLTSLSPFYRRTVPFPSSLISCQLSVLTVECPTETTIEETAPGKYKVSYTPVTIGSHQLRVSVGNVEIPQSPFGVKISAVPDSKLAISDFLTKDILVGGEHIIMVQKGYIHMLDKKTEKTLRTRTSDLWGSEAFTATSATILHNGDILFADCYHGRIVRLSRTMEWLTSAGFEGRGSDICVHPNGHILVVDSCRNCISVLDNDLSLLYCFGKQGSEPGEFKNPQKVAVDQGGNVYITDKDNDRIQKFTLNGEFIHQFGKIENEELESLHQPHAISINKDTGTVYISSESRVLIFDTDGKFKGDFFTTSHINGLALDAETGFLYIWASSGEIAIYNTPKLLQQIPLHTAQGAQN